MVRTPGNRTSWVIGAGAGYQLSVSSRQFPVVSCQLSVVSYQPLAVSLQPSGISRQPSAVSQQPSAIGHPPSAFRRRRLACGRRGGGGRRRVDLGRAWGPLRGPIRCDSRLSATGAAWNGTGDPWMACGDRWSATRRKRWRIYSTVVRTMRRARRHHAWVGDGQA